jgi:hypothetical protein
MRAAVVVKLKHSNKAVRRPEYKDEIEKSKELLKKNLLFMLQVSM